MLRLIAATLALNCAGLLLDLAAVSPAWAFDEGCTYRVLSELDSRDRFCYGYNAYTPYGVYPPLAPQEDAAAAAAPAQPIAAVFRVSNFYSGIDPGEPTLGGRMKKTIWGGFFSPQAKRVVVATFQTPVRTRST
jgi:hypothetical protein